MFIVIEGIDGSGKSTVAKKLVERLREVHEVLHTWEPGHVREGLYRRLIMEDVDLPYAVAALFTADRAEHVRDMIKPALERGIWVVSERYADSTLAYQGYGMGLDHQLIQRMNEEAVQGLWPDITFYLNVPPEVAYKRIHGKEKDALEEQGIEFLRRVHLGYLEIAQMRGWRLVDGSLPPDDIAKVMAEEVLA
ncbi:dTMP kinase [Coprothermobacteraceae bacterium]|nr:dTMP kinase [Coprothermobacteraceae bacterium]